MSMNRSSSFLLIAVVLGLFGRGVGQVAGQVEEGFLNGADGVQIHYQKIGQGGTALVVLHRDSFQDVLHGSGF